MRRGPLASVALAALTLAAACIRPADRRLDMETEVGRAVGGGLDVTVRDGQAQVLSLGGERLSMWAQAPALFVDIVPEATAAPTYTVELQNCLPDAVLIVRSQGQPDVVAPRGMSVRPAVCEWSVDVGPVPLELEVTAPDATDMSRWQFAVMGDIQTALPRVDELFAVVNGRPEIRFVVATGDLVEEARGSEYDLLFEKLATLDVPFYSTIGNHELNGDIDLWRDRIGRFNVHFDFRGVSFSFLDSGNASFDPGLYDQLEGWLAQASDRIHLFGTHYPAIDPIGVRNAGFRSRKEAAKLLARLAEGNVDVTFYGHLHSFYDYSNAGIPAYVSGGGGARPERWDGIGRHFLQVEVDPTAATVYAVSAIRVD